MGDFLHKWNDLQLVGALGILFLVMARNYRCIARGTGHYRWQVDNDELQDEAMAGAATDYQYSPLRVPRQ